MPREDEDLSKKFEAIISNSGAALLLNHSDGDDDYYSHVGGGGGVDMVPENDIISEENHIDLFNQQQQQPMHSKADKPSRNRTVHQRT